MTEWEICREYKTAKFPKEQIKILADMNGCGVKDIKQILAENGLYNDEIKQSVKKKKRKAGKSKKNFWTEEEVKTLIEMRKQGARRAEIAEAIGRKPERITSKISELRRREGIII